MAFGIFRNDELGIIGLAETFKTAGRVHAVADRSEARCAAPSHFAEHDIAKMDADADPQGPGQIVRERPVEIIDAARHAERRGECVPGGLRRIAVDPEQCHDAVADEFVDAPAARFDPLSHDGEIAVEEENDIFDLGF